MRSDAKAQDKSQRYLEILYDSQVVVLGGATAGAGIAPLKLQSVQRFERRNKALGDFFRPEIS